MSSTTTVDGSATTDAAPRVSVILPNYNHARYLPQALAAIATQDYPSCEVLVVDDGSTDESRDIIRGFAARYPQLRVLECEHNRGVEYCIQWALREARGTFLAFQSADDYVHPGFLARSMALLDAHPAAKLCCSDPVFLPDGQAESVYRLRWAREPRCFAPVEAARVLRRQYIYGHTALLSREALMEVGGFRPELRWHCDWFAFHAIALRYGFCYLPAELAVLRVRAGSYSARGRSDRAAQVAIRQAMLAVMARPEFRDVDQAMRESGLLAALGPDVVTAIRRERAWGQLTLPFLSRICRHVVRRQVARVTPARWKAWWRRKRECL